MTGLLELADWIKGYSNVDVIALLEENDAYFEEEFYMISEKLVKGLTEQMNYEFYSAHAYLAMAGYCSAENLDGFANFFLVQAEEERFHAMKFYNFINNMGERVSVEGFDAPDRKSTRLNSSH